ncbi:MAG: DNA repair protein RecO [Geitlerinemataceae cyanobacterium]
MSRTYRATGINLKSAPLGESDRILTILTRDRGLIRAVAAGSRKPKSSLGGRCNLFVVNEWMIANGKSLDRLTQAETIASYPGLARNLGLLTAAQYLAELVLFQTPDDRPDPHLFDRTLELLDRLEALPADATPAAIVANLCLGIFRLLDFAGLAPQVRECSATGIAIVPNPTNRDWRSGFNYQVGGALDLNACRELQKLRDPEIRRLWNLDRDAALALRMPTPDRYVNATELTLLQHLASDGSLDRHYDALTANDLAASWANVENLLRQYAQYHLGRGIQSANLLDSYTTAMLAVPHPRDPAR